MTYHIRETKNGTMIIESDGYSSVWNGVWQGTWVGKVSIPKKYVEQYVTDDKICSWRDADGMYNVGTIGELFATVASRSVFAPAGCIRYNCRKVQ